MAVNDPLETGEESEAPSTGGGSRFIVWIIIVALGLLFVPIYLIGSTITEGSTELQSTLDAAQATLAFTPPADPSEVAISATLDAVRQQSNTLSVLQSTLVALHINWPSVMSIIGNFDPSRMSLTGVAQTTPSTITISGQADDQNTVTAYADMLRKSGLFDPVSIGAINMQAAPTATPSPTPLPSPTPQATAAAATPQGTLQGTLPPAPTPVGTAGATPTPASIAIFQITVTIKTTSAGG